MTDKQRKSIKILSYAHWVISKEFNTEEGIRDIEALKTVVSLPENRTLTCLLGEKLESKSELYTQLGWFIYYSLESEPFNSKNKSVIVLLLYWILNHYNLDYDEEQIANYIDNLNTMTNGNADISNWFSENIN